MRHLIIGIDPGATTAYAVLDIDGNIISVKSAKEFPLSRMIEQIYSHGKPFAVGCDKKEAPSLIREFSAKTGAKIISPRKDLTTEEKTALAPEKPGNSHESDALASAKYAYNSLKETIEKAKSISEDAGKIASTAVKEGVNLAEAKARLERREVLIIKQKTRQSENTQKLIERIHALEERNTELNSTIEKLKKEIGALYDRRLRKNSHDNSAHKLTNAIIEKENETAELKNKIRTLEEFLRDNIVAKKFKSLSSINTKDSIIIVENLESIPQKETEKLKGTLKFIISDKTADIPFTILKKEGLVLKETDSFALVSKKELEKRTAKKDILARIIAEYKESRDK